MPRVKRTEGGAPTELKVKPKPKPPAPPPSPPPSPPPITPAKRLGSYGNASIDQWDEAFIAASDAVFAKRSVRVRPHVMKGMMDVETGGDGDYPAGRCRECDGTDCTPACGPMQIKRPYHFHRCPECDFSTVEGQIELATHIIGMTMLDRGRDEYDALVTTYFPRGDENGTTQKMYVDRVRELERIMDADLAGKPPDEPGKPKPGKKVTEQDILNLISSNAPGVYISFPFRGVGSAIYAYGKGHGTTSNAEHSGIDIWMPDETPVNCVFGGEVVCVGAAGRVVWGQGCGYFNDDNGGLGNITILTDRTIVVAGKQRRVKMTYGHMSSATVRVGQTVAAGERIGRSGIGGGWPHVHLDFVIDAPDLNNPQIWNNGGEYHLIDPIPAILSVLGSGSLPASYAQRVPVPQPEEFDEFFTVETIEDGVPVLQRAFPGAPEVDSPFKKGETFEAVYIAAGRDGVPYWIGRRGGRVPLKGTRGPSWVKGV